MAEGTQPENIKDVTPITKELTEALVDLDKATFEAPSKLEEGDIQSAEKVQEQFTALVDVAADRRPKTEDRAAVAETAPAAETPPAESSLDGKTHDPADHFSGVEMTQGEVAQDSDWNEGESKTEPLSADLDSSSPRGLDSSEIGDNTGTSTIPGGSVLADAAEGRDALQSSSGNGGSATDGTNDADSGDGSLDDESSSSDDNGSESSADEDGSTSADPDPSDNSTENITPPSYERTQSTMDNIEGQNESVIGAVEGLISANEALKLAQETLSELIQEEPNREDYETDEDYAATIKAHQQKTESPKKVEEGATKVQNGDQKSSEDVDSRTDSYAQEMTGAKPGEVRGFDNEENDNPYILEVSGESGENGENQIIIPIGNSQIDFAGAAREVQKTDDFTWKLTVAKDETGEFRVPGLHPTQIELLPDRDPSGEYLKIPGYASDLEVTQQENPPAYDPDLKPDEAGADQQESSDRKASTREEILTLQDELSDWPDGETREITYTDWEKQADGTYVEVEKTVTLTKEGAEDLLDQMEEGLEDTEGRRTTETLYQLVEGSLLVSEAAGPELAPDAGELLDGMVIERREELPETPLQDEGTSELPELLEQAKMLEDEVYRLMDILNTYEGGEVKEVTYSTLEKTGDHSYQTKSVTTSVTSDGLEDIINALDWLKQNILKEWQFISGKIAFPDTLTVASPPVQMEKIADAGSTDDQDSDHNIELDYGKPTSE